MRKDFLMALATSFLLLQVLFLGNMRYLYATQFQDTTRIHNLNLLFVDYDGGVIGQSVLDGYQILHPEDVKNAVCNGDYWGAIYADHGGSANLESALTSGNIGLTSLTYIWNGARAVDTRSLLCPNASGVVAFAPLTTNPTSLNAFLNPIQAREINIKITEQGPRVLYNTVSIVMPIIQQFFFMMALNGLSAQFHLFTKSSWITNGLLRMGISLVYTSISALCMVAYIWAFRETWDVNGNQFALCWVAIWLYMHINFVAIDSLTAFVPMQFLPFGILTWVIVNVASTISPFELSPGFFRWGYALPSHELYQVLVQIWSDGCDNQLYRALPIMFSWWIAGLGVVVIAMRYRCRIALSAEMIMANSSGDHKGDKMEAPPPSRHSSTQAIVLQQRWNTVESIELEHFVYGPSLPTPLDLSNDE